MTRDSRSRCDAVCPSRFVSVAAVGACYLRHNRHEHGSQDNKRCDAWTALLHGENCWVLFRLCFPIPERGYK